MFNSKARPKKIKSFKFDFNLVINDKVPSQKSSQSLNNSKNNTCSEICEKSILNNQGNKTFKIISSCPYCLWKNHGKWKESFFTKKIR